MKASGASSSGSRTDEEEEEKEAKDEVVTEEQEDDVLVSRCHLWSTVLCLVRLWIPLKRHFLVVWENSPEDDSRTSSTSTCPHIRQSRLVLVRLRSTGLCDFSGRRLQAFFVFSGCRLTVEACACVSLRGVLLISRLST